MLRLSSHSPSGGDYGIAVMSSQLKVLAPSAAGFRPQSARLIKLDPLESGTASVCEVKVVSNLHVIIDE